MHDLQKEYEYCKELLDKLGIPYNKDFDVFPNHRAQRRWGQCRFGRYEINISDRLLDERVPVKSLRQVILHELLHTVPNCQDHQFKWQSLAAKVNFEYGFNISRTDSAKELKVPEDLMNRQEYKYVFVCEKCGNTVRQLRASKFTKHPERYVCGKCGGKFYDASNQKTVASSVKETVDCKEKPEGLFQAEENGQLRFSFWKGE